MSTAAAAIEVVIVNSGVGNVRSVANMLRRVGVPSTISADAAVVRGAAALILPGVGSYDAAMRRLRQAGLPGAIGEAAAAGTPLLGLCLGMQLLADGSEEGDEAGFGLVPGYLRRLPARGDDGVAVNVPQMGWNIIGDTDGCVLYDGMQVLPRFYFNHSYYLWPPDLAHLCGTARHGVSLAAGIRRGNVFGVQFHPEKSHRFGLQLLGNFVRFASARARPQVAAAEASP